LDEHYGYGVVEKTRMIESQVDRREGAKWAKAQLDIE
jgi:hypothetical protein